MAYFSCKKDMIHVYVYAMPTTLWMGFKIMEENKTKTHWLQNPNKNYLGHWDLPNGNPIILTIKSAKWEEVKNPIINVSEAKRVIRFEESNIKPFICNETNAQSIMRSTKKDYLEDSCGMKIKLYQSKVNFRGDMIDCLRIKEVPQSELTVKYITEEQRDLLLELIEPSGKTVQEICTIMKVESISLLPEIKYENMCKRLKELANGDN